MYHCCKGELCFNFYYTDFMGYEGNPVYKLNQTKLHDILSA